jgi:hypothetical protein
MVKEIPTMQENSPVFKPLELVEINSSGARLLLAEINSQKIVRKIKLSPQEKLIEQYNWLKAHEHLDFVVSPFNPIKTDQSFSYDMPYYDQYKNGFLFFQKNKSQQKLREILKLTQILNRELGIITPEQVLEYIETKLVKKLLKCLDNDPALNSYSSRILNLQTVLCEKNSLWAQGKNCDIHGDLTLENILIGPDDKIVFIDPNGENTISPIESEYAKLFQSLHSRYEDLSQPKNITPHDLFPLLRDHILQKHGQDSLIRTYFHEVIHLARLLPYKQINRPQVFKVFWDLFFLRADQLIEKIKAL